MTRKRHRILAVFICSLSSFIVSACWLGSVLFAGEGQPLLSVAYGAMTLGWTWLLCRWIPETAS